MSKSLSLCVLLGYMNTRASGNVYQHFEQKQPMKTSHNVRGCGSICHGNGSEMIVRLCDPEDLEDDNPIWFP
jgi:hypothetical protein